MSLAKDARSFVRGARDYGRSPYLRLLRPLSTEILCERLVWNERDPSNYLS